MLQRFLLADPVPPHAGVVRCQAYPCIDPFDLPVVLLLHDASR